MNDRHAVFAICADGVSFRLGQPADWHTAVTRQTRLRWEDPRARAIRHEHRRYLIRDYEVRAVDRHGRGLGSERHARAIPVPFRRARLV